MTRTELKHLQSELDRAIKEERTHCADLVRAMASTANCTMYEVADAIEARTDQYEFVQVQQ